MVELYVLSHAGSKRSGIAMGPAVELALFAHHGIGRVEHVGHVGDARRIPEEGTPQECVPEAQLILEVLRGGGGVGGDESEVAGAGPRSPTELGRPNVRLLEHELAERAAGVRNRRSVRRRR